MTPNNGNGAGTRHVAADSRALLRLDPVPRPLPFVTVKRTGPRLREPYGHWWVEVGRAESYGWWPDRPLRLRHWFTGTGGCLNGAWFNKHASSTRDSLHRVAADHSFHPLLVVDQTDEDVLAAIRAFAAAYEGGWRWRWPWSRRPARNCRTFQLDLFRAVGIAEQPALLHTHGSGCPVLFPVRERLARWRLRMNGSLRARQ